MPRYIDAYMVDDLFEPFADVIENTEQRSAFLQSLQAVQDAPTIDVPTWIPCSERLPRARESVLLAVNHKYGDWVGEGCYWETTDNHIIWKGYRWNATYWDDEIIAWMPLPKPYKETDHE